MSFDFYQDAGSPGQVGSPGTESSMTPGIVSCDVFGLSDDPISDSNVTSNGVVDVLENHDHWAAEEIDDFDIAELSVSVSVALGNNEGNSPGRAVFNQDRNSRNRMKSRLQAKGLSAFPSLPTVNGMRLKASLAVTIFSCNFQKISWIHFWIDITSWSCLT